MTDFRYSQSEFNHLLFQFQGAVENGEYTEKIAYDTWRKLKKLTGPIVIEYEAPFVKISYEFREYDGSISKQIVYSTKIYENGFGRFFYDYVVKEKIRMNINTFTNAVAENTASAKSMLEFKADLMQSNDYCHSSATATADKIYSYDDNGSTYSNYGTATGIAETVKIAGESISGNTTNTVELNIPSLDYFGYHQIDGTWDSVASKSEVETRFKKLEAELQKKVDKTEKNECVKEKNTMMKGINFDFGPCGNTVRLSMYGMAIQNISGEWVSYNPDSGEIINVDVFNMADGGKYMYKMPVAIADVKKGDIVIHNRVPMFVTAINENGTFEVTDVRAGETKNIIPTRNMFGFNFMTKVVSMFGAFADAPTADQPFGNMLPFLMMGENNDIDPVMMFMMMNQGGNNGAMNAMMLHYMTKDKKDIDPAMMWMVMSMMSGAAPAFMTGNYPKATIASDVQK